MKQCYNIKTWEEQKNVMISLNEKEIFYQKTVWNPTKTKLLKRNIYIQQSTPTDPILAKLCELTGAKMYEDYIILEEATYMDAKVLIGDIYVYYTIREWEVFRYYIILIDKIIGSYNSYEIPLEKEEYFKPLIEKPGESNTNIFEEYSKFLREEENRWEEVKNILKL